jgi:hypothetical protein
LLINKGNGAGVLPFEFEFGLTNILNIPKNNEASIEKQEPGGPFSFKSKSKQVFTVCADTCPSEEDAGSACGGTGEYFKNDIIHLPHQTKATPGVGHYIFSLPPFLQLHSTINTMPGGAALWMWLLHYWE